MIIYSPYSSTITNYRDNIIKICNHELFNSLGGLIEEEFTEFVSKSFTNQSLQ